MHQPFFSGASARRAVFGIALLGLPLSACSRLSGSSQPTEAIHTEVIHIEAESGALVGTNTATSKPGFSGQGYVTGFDKDGDTVNMSIPGAKAGIYDVTVRYSSREDKGFGLIINGAKSSGIFKPSGPGFATQDVGKIMLKDGDNTLSIDRGWGWYDLDYIEFTPAKIDNTLAKPPATLVDGKADAPTRALMQLLVDNYGQKTLSGQYAPENQYVQDLTGKTPAIYGSDLIEYSPSRVLHGTRVNPSTEQMIETTKGGQILTLLWHWNAPSHLINNEKHVDKSGKPVNAIWWRGFYTDASTFDLQKALANPQSQEYKLLLSDIDAIAVQLKKLQAAGVPVLWRPLHEADGGWFWWGAKGPEPFKQLWRLMFDRLTKKHQLHNLIWVYTGSDNKMDWYPGDDVVDIFGVDSYPDDRTDPLTGPWEGLHKRFDGKKLVALTEFKGVPDIGKMRQFGVNWSYFVSWTKEVGTSSQDKEQVKRTYADSFTGNLNDLKR